MTLTFRHFKCVSPTSISSILSLVLAPLSKTIREPFLSLLFTWLYVSGKCCKSRTFPFFTVIPIGMFIGSASSLTPTVIWSLSGLWSLLYPCLPSLHFVP